MLIEIIRNRKIKFIFLIAILFLALVILLFYKKNENNISEYTKEQLQTEEFHICEGTWKVVEYMDMSVEFSGVDINSEEYIKKNTQFIDSVKKEYLDKVLVIKKSNIKIFSPSSELGYQVANYDDLFFMFRQPTELSIVPPFVCASIQLKNELEIYDIIFDSENVAILYVNSCFFRLEKVSN